MKVSQCNSFYIILVLATSLNNKAEGIQCFSCKGTGINELLANANCLENGYLENCDDFYEYYAKVNNFYLIDYIFEINVLLTKLSRDYIRNC